MAFLLFLVVVAMFFGSQALGFFIVKLGAVGPLHSHIQLRNLGGAGTKTRPLFVW